MATATATYKVPRIPVITKKNDKGVIRVIYPAAYVERKTQHKAKLDNTLNILFKGALVKRFKDPVEKKIAGHIYDEHYSKYKFGLDDLSISREPWEDDEMRYIATIQNDKWFVAYYIEILKYGRPIKERMREYVAENICYFNRNLIFRHLEDYRPPSEEKAPSTFEDNNTKCPICLDEYNDEKEYDKLHNCGHKYCVDCIEQAIKFGKCCICRISTDIEETFGITEEDIDNLCDDDDAETLTKLLEEFGEFDNFCAYCAGADGYCHTLGYETEEDIELENGTHILMCRLDTYEHKTPTLNY